MLQISHFSKTYPGGKKAVDDLSLEVRNGEIFGFIGKNGAGKTTTLRAVAGILPFESGSIQIDGIDITKDPIGAKQITAFLPDNPDLYEYYTGIKYLNFLGDIYGIPQDLRNIRIKEYARQLEFEKPLGDSVGSYSHGMKQKLAIISALIRNPKLLILDEPFVGLDPEASFHLKNLMRTLCDQGSSIFFSTHVLEVAEKICDSIGILREGKLIACGSTKTVVGDRNLEDVFLQLAGEGEVHD